MLDLDLILKQKLNISNKLIQSLEVLTMPIDKLEEYLIKESEENVMLDFKSKLDDPKFVSSIKDVYSEKSHNDFLNFDNVNSKKDSIEDYLLFQLLSFSFSKQKEDIIKYLIFSLDENGYLDINLDELSNDLNISVEFILDAQKSLLEFEPKGVGALDLRECLLAQIQTKDKLLYSFVDKHLDNLYKKNFEDIKNDLKIDDNTLKVLINSLKKLNPRPLSSIDTNEFEKVIIPDIFVDYKNDEIQIEVEKVNTVKLNQYYLNMLESDIDDVTREYLKNKLNKTLLIKRAIDKRNDTIEKIAKYLINYQKDFFQKNLPLKAVTQTDIANIFSISISTVSRAVRDKYIEYPGGIILLQDLFSSSIKGNDFSKDYIIKIISVIIKDENEKKPLTDQELKKILNQMDIKIERRTVQKYRTLLNIPSSAERKKIYKLKNI